MYSVIIINMLTCAAVLIFKFYSKSVESYLISGMAVQETNRNRHISNVSTVVIPCLHRQFTGERKKNSSRAHGKMAAA